MDGEIAEQTVDDAITYDDESLNYEEDDEPCDICGELGCFCHSEE